MFPFQDNLEGADASFLTMTEQCFNVAQNPWVSISGIKIDFQYRDFWNLQMNGVGK